MYRKKNKEQYINKANQQWMERVNNAAQQQPLHTTEHPNNERSYAMHGKQIAGTTIDFRQ